MEAALTDIASLLKNGDSLLAAGDALPAPVCDALATLIRNTAVLLPSASAIGPVSEMQSRLNDIMALTSLDASVQLVLAALAVGQQHQHKAELLAVHEARVLELAGGLMSQPYGKGLRSCYLFLRETLLQRSELGGGDPVDTFRYFAVRRPLPRFASLTCIPF